MMLAFRRVSGFLSQRCTSRVSPIGSSLFTTPSAETHVEAITERMRKEAEIEMHKLVSYYKELPLQQQQLPMLWSSREEASSFVKNKIDAVLFDCDGVLYRTPDPAPGASKCVKTLMEQGKKIFFVTNNAGSSREQLKHKLTEMLKVEGLENEQMICAAFSAAQFLRQQQKEEKMKGTKLHAIGSRGLCDELEHAGFQVSGGPSTEKASMDRQELAEYNFPEHPIDAIVVGHDIEFTFRKLSIANNLLQRNPDAILVATNRDSFDLVGSDGRHIPGNGAIVAALEYCSRRTAINVGKPSKVLIDLVQANHQLDLSRSMFVGDRLDTDIRFGIETGMVSALVMTGVTTADYMIKLGQGTEEEPLPSVILPHVGLLI